MIGNEHLKIVVAGGTNTGKKSFIGAITEEHILKEWPNIERPGDLFPRATFGRIPLGNNEHAFLFSAVSFGSASRDVSWDILIEGMSALCLLVDSTNPQSIYEGQAILKYLTLLDPVPYIVVANKQDLDGALAVGQIWPMMELPSETLIVPCMAIERASVANVLNTLLPMIRPDRQERIK